MNDEIESFLDYSEFLETFSFDLGVLLKALNPSLLLMVVLVWKSEHIHSVSRRFSVAFRVLLLANINNLFSI